MPIPPSSPPPRPRPTPRSRVASPQSSVASPPPPLHAPQPTPVALPSALQPSALPPLTTDFPPLSRQTSTKSNRSTAALQSVVSGRSQTDDEDGTPVTQGEKPDEPHPLQAEVERLTAQCEDHARRFRSSKATFEHRVFSEYPSILARLGELDARAEKATADVYAALHEAVPALRARLAALEDERSADVETMRSRTTPWRDFLPDDGDDDDGDGVVLSGSGGGSGSGSSPEKGGGSSPMGRTRSGGRRRGKIQRIERMRVADCDRDAHAITLVEKWGDEVTISLQDQIARLKSQLFEEGRKRNIVIRLVLMLASFAAMVLLFLALRKGHASLFL